MLLPGLDDTSGMPIRVSREAPDEGVADTGTTETNGDGVPHTDAAEARDD